MSRKSLNSNVPIVEKSHARIQASEKDRKEQAEVIRRLTIQNVKMLKQVAALKEQATSEKNKSAQQQIEIDLMKHRNTNLSEALGSCHICWGDDNECPNCKGKGIAGWQAVNKRYFNIYILPCLEVMYEFNNSKK
ncbi:MAG: hypothetical protein H7Y27_07805 [Gemmatimonadaceae bacterium]|nr:hypothetical protein [Chitinophagaceae bacterium]